MYGHLGFAAKLGIGWLRDGLNWSGEVVHISKESKTFDKKQSLFFAISALVESFLDKSIIGKASVPDIYNHNRLTSTDILIQ